MLFNSLHFVFFFPLVVVVYFLLKDVKHRRLMLLLASWYFYASWKPEYLILLLVSTIVDYFSAIQIGKQDTKKRKRKWIYVSLFVNLLILISFKYFNFFDKNIFRVFSHFNIIYTEPTYDFLLPVGISFYTFQTMSYTIDVYRNRIKPEKNFVKFALFVSFFPQLVAGPIERASHLLPQFDKKHKFDYQRITDGFKLVVWGFFQKLVIADNMSRFVDAVYQNSSYYYGLDIWLATFFFAIQIYGDFSGYTDIARGTAKILGYDLNRNFNLPYFSTSISQFWKRWHISLSNWFRDYVYIELGGNRTSRFRFIINIFITFVISGFWHGASWNFIIWGALHGIYYTIERFFNSRILKNKKISEINIFYKIIKITFVFILVNFAWIFFRSESVSISLTLIKHSFEIKSLFFSFDRPSLLLNFILISILFITHLIERRNNLIKFLSKQHYIIRWGIYYFILIFLIIFGNYEIQEFIYFQF